MYGCGEEYSLLKASMFFSFFRVAGNCSEVVTCTVLVLTGLNRKELKQRVYTISRSSSLRVASGRSLGPKQPILGWLPDPPLEYDKKRIRIKSTCL